MGTKQRFFTLLLATLILSFPGYPHSRDKNIGIPASSRLEDFNYTQYIKNGHAIEKQFTITGKKAGTEGKRMGIFFVTVAREFVIEKPEATFFAADKPVSVLTASRCIVAGKLHGPNKGVFEKLRFTENVSMKACGNEAVLSASSITWNKKDGHIIAKGNCTAIQGKNIYSGEVLSTDIELKNIRK